MTRVVVGVDIFKDGFSVAGLGADDTLLHLQERLDEVPITCGTVSGEPLRRF